MTHIDFQELILYNEFKLRGDEMNNFSIVITDKYEIVITCFPLSDGFLGQTADFAKIFMFDSKEDVTKEISNEDKIVVGDFDGIKSIVEMIDLFEDKKLYSN
jgi:hypothetical protein